jgi:hypothetical protein
MMKDRDIAEDQKRTAVLKGLSNQNQTEVARGVLEAMRDMLVNDKAVIARANEELQSVQAKVAAVKAEDDAASKRVSEASAKLKAREAEKAHVKKQLREADKKEDLAEMAQKLRKQLADEIQGINILTSDRMEQTTRLVKLEVHTPLPPPLPPLSSLRRVWRCFSTFIIHLRFTPCPFDFHGRSLCLPSFKPFSPEVARPGECDL